MFPQRCGARYLHIYATGFCRRKKKRDKISFQLEVLPQTLPPGTEWTFHLDLWQNPYAVARVAGVEPWSQGHWDALRPVMKMLADAGQKVITATLNKRPWNGQTEDAFDSMIGWTKNRTAHGHSIIPFSTIGFNS